MADETKTQRSDAELIDEAEKLFAVEKLLSAAEILERVSDESLLRNEHKWMIRWARIIRDGMDDLLTPPTTEGTNWKKQTEKHGHRDFTVYYQVSQDNQLTCRIDSVIESSLLVPTLSVFNESDLYHTWMPSYKKPIKLGIDQSKKIKETGRGNQVIQVTANMAWPFNTREVVQHAVAVDAIDDKGAIAVQVETESHEDDPDIPHPLKGVVRVDMSCTILIRGCPSGHELLSKSKHKYPEGEELILISVKSKVDAHVAGVPLSVINFVSRTVFGRLWSNLIGVAEGIREGTRPAHQDAIGNNRELYAWVEGRIGVMMEKVKEQSDHDVVQIR